MSKKRFAAGILAALVAFTALAVVLAGSVSAKPKAATATFRAALVSDVGRFNDKSFNQSQLAGLNRAKKVLKIQVLPIQSNSSSDYIPNLTTAIRKPSNIVIAAGYLMAADLATIAAQFPKTHFAITDDAVSGTAERRRSASSGGSRSRRSTRSWLVTEQVPRSAFRIAS